MHGIGRTGAARDLFERLIGLRNDVGMLAEECDPGTGRHLGNTPQAFSLVGLVNAARRLGYLRTQSAMVCTSPGPGTPTGAGVWWSRPSSRTWKDADMKKMVLPCC